MSQDKIQERQQAILLEIIRYYLSHQEAISARTLAKFSQLALSPTTIRNLMEDLSLEGYLTSEGVSRGRIPTQKAFTIYVTTLEGMEIKESVSTPADEDQLPTLQLALEQVGLFLAEESGYIALASLPEKDRYPLDWVRLVHITEHRLLVAVQSMYGDLWSKVIPMAEPFPPEVLKGVEWHICREYHGLPMQRIREVIMTGETKELLEDLPSLGAAFRLLRKAFDWDKSRGWQVWGTENLYGIREYQLPEKLVHIHQALADPQLLGAVLRNARRVEGGQVAIGTEMDYPGLEESAMVGYVFADKDEGDWQGMIALLGPMRMDYALALTLIRQAAHTLEHNLRETRRNASSA